MVAWKISFPHKNSLWSHITGKTTSNKNYFIVHHVAAISMNENTNIYIYVTTLKFSLYNLFICLRTCSLTNFYNSIIKIADFVLLIQISKRKKVKSF